MLFTADKAFLRAVTTILYRCLVELVYARYNSFIERFQVKEPTVAQSCEHLLIDYFNMVLNSTFVSWFSCPCRNHNGIVMISEILHTSVDIGFIAVTLGYGRF